MKKDVNDEQTNGSTENDVKMCCGGGSPESKRQKFSTLLVEVVFLAILLGLIPELVVGGIADLFGPCLAPDLSPGGPTHDQLCAEVSRQGLVKLSVLLIVSFVTVALAFMLSQEYNRKK